MREGDNVDRLYRDYLVKTGQSKGLSDQQLLLMTTFLPDVELVGMSIGETADALTDLFVDYIWVPRDEPRWKVRGELTAEDRQRRFTFTGRYVPVYDLLLELARQTGTTFRLEDKTVVLTGVK